MLRELRGGPSTHKGQKRHRRRRLFRAAFAVVVIITLLTIAAVLIFVWYSGQHANVVVTDPKPKVTNVAKELVKIDQNQPVGVFITELTSPTTAGSNASVSIRTFPGAACSITVAYNGLKSIDAGLIPKDADEYGVLRWSWKIEQGQPVGKWPVDITCAAHGKSGYMRGDLVITKQ